MKNNTHKIVITLAESTDLSAILSLQKLCYVENATRYNNHEIPPLTQTITDLQEEFERSLFLKAVDNSSTIRGSIRGYTDGETCYICRLFVHPRYQNLGIGKKLLSAIEHHFELVSRFELFTGYRDDKNIALYTKMGYRKYGEKERDHDGMRFYLMEKKVL